MSDPDARIALCHRRHVGELEAYARSLLGGDHATAQDVVQEAFLRTHRVLSREPDRKIALRPWLYRAVRNAAIDELRTARRHRVTYEGTAPERGGPDAYNVLTVRDAAHDALRRVARLPDRQRTALTLHALGGLDHDEIAAALGTTRGASRVLVHRARAAAAL